MKAIGIDRDKLEAFRASLPEIGRREVYQMLIRRWCIVTARFLAQESGLEPTVMDRELIEKVAEAHFLDSSPDAITFHLMMRYVDREYAMSDAVDLSKPLVFGCENLMGKSMLVLLDGGHRLYKAYHTGADSLRAFLLTAEETEVCRIGS